ncbi:beta-lactamase family protein [Streptomonospora sp. NEAU-YY374]|nr:beta-lactamase family protein [Streptomonospora nanhaiensis]MBX9386961.1 beta-lactamase family protein [Streptomonospora nanhaiensis]
MWALGDGAGLVHHGGAGVLDPDDPTPVGADTLWDLASLTKVIAVWALIGTWWQTGALDLDEPLGRLMPDEVDGAPLSPVTVRQLLTHTAGLPLRSRQLYGTEPERIRRGSLREALNRPPGQAIDYTDRAALILGYLAEHLGSAPLPNLATERVWAPLGMDDTRFGPLPDDLAVRAAPTEVDGRDLPGRAGQLRQQCGVVAGTGSDFQDVVAGLDVELVEHHRHDPRHRRTGQSCAIGRPLGDDGLLGVRLDEVGVGDERVSRHAAHRLQHPLRQRMQAGDGLPVGDDPVDHLGAQLLGRAGLVAGHGGHGVPSLVGVDTGGSVLGAEQQAGVPAAIGRVAGRGGELGELDSGLAVQQRRAGGWC